MKNYFMYDNNIISDAFLVVEITQTLLPDRNIEVLDILSRDGQVFNGSNYAPVEFDITILVSGESEYELQNNLRALRDILVVKKPVKLAIKEDRFGYGMVTEKITMARKSKLDVLCTTHIKCFSPYFYSNEERLFINDTDKKVLTINNKGGVSVKPFITVGITKNCNFVQLQNDITKETLLLGNYPKLEYTTVDEKSDILYDTCTTTSNWTASTLPIDNNRVGGGTLGVVSGKAGLCIGALPTSSSSEKWKGVEVRRNLPNSQDEFKLTAELTFTSTGVNGDPTILQTDVESITSGQSHVYYVVNTAVLNVRKLPDVKSELIGTISKGTAIKKYVIVNNGWLRYTSTNGNTCYVSMKYLTKRVETTTVTNRKRNVAVQSLTYLFSDVGTAATVLKVLPVGTVLRIDTTQHYESYDSDKVVRSWWKLATPYDGVIGYVCNGNLFPWDENTGPIYKLEYDEKPKTADDKTGVIELYGMGANNERLFKIAITDDNEWYEYTSPSITLGTNTILCRDSTLLSPPKHYTETTTSGTKTTNYLSGAVGDYNDFYGTISLERAKDSKGNYIWTFNLAKIKNGVVEIAKTGSLPLNNIATEKLSYIILYMGTYTSLEKCSDMALNSLRVQGITSNNTGNVNVVEFKEGDVIDIDFENRNVYVNHERRNDLVNISSRYFNIEKGINNIKIFSNDEQAVVGAAINEAWIGSE